MQTGTIIFYLPEKGYGYLRLLDTREDFHFRAKNLLADTISAGELVSFELKQGRQGYFADQIRRKGLA
jgi:cold shock CspA family protein